jgi:hypothetical protein
MSITTKEPPQSYALMNGLLVLLKHMLNVLPLPPKTEN